MSQNGGKINHVPLLWHLIVNPILSGQGWRMAVQECFNISGMPTLTQKQCLKLKAACDSPKFEEAEGCIVACVGGARLCF